MNEFRFDNLSQRVGTSASRRQMLGGLLGTAVGVLAGIGVAGRSGVEAKKGGNGKAKSKARGRANGQGKATDKGKGVTKVSFCHKDEESGTYAFITVGEPARQAHEKHGDVECVAVPCKVANGVCDVSEEGDVTCGYYVATSEEPIACGERGVCDENGNCVEAVEEETV